MIAAEQGTGKTTVAGQLAVHRIGVRESEFLGYSVEQLRAGERDVYLALDRPTQIAASFRRMKDVGDGRGRRFVRERLGFWEGPLPFNILERPGLLAEWIDDLWPDSVGVVIDSVKDLAPGKPLTSDEVATALNAAWQSVLVSGRELLLLHHHRKTAAGADGAPKTLADVFGSTFLTAGLGSVITFQGKPGARDVRLRHLKPPQEPVGPFLISHDHATGVSMAEPVKDLLAFLVGCGVSGGSVREAAMYLCGADDRAAMERTRRALARLKQEGTARYVPGRSGGRTGGRAGGRTEGRWTAVR